MTDLASPAPALALLACGLAGCSGPQPLDRAIRPSDEEAYLAIVADAVPEPSLRESFYRARADERGITVEEARRLDEALSTTRNPFEARRDPVAVSRGAVVYKYECMACHGVQADGGGADMPVHLPSMDFHRGGMRFAVTVHGGAPRSWFHAVHDGTSVLVDDPERGPTTVEMPAYADRLAREQIWLVVTYLQSLDADLPRRDAQP